MGSPDILKFINSFDGNHNEIIEIKPRAKKRRLDHLSWDEKIQRKKLKNRVAAQTSRDRKKARIEQMENTLNELCTRNEALLSECENLKAINERLSAENADLKIRLTLQPVSSCSNCKQLQQQQNRSVGSETVLTGSAESFFLQPKGTVTHPAAVLEQQQQLAIRKTTLLKIVLTYLLYRTCLTSSIKTSTLERWRKSHRAYSKISQKTWKQLLKKQIIKNLLLVDKGVMEKWWGKHQKTWNPVDVLEC